MPPRPCGPGGVMFEPSLGHMQLRQPREAESIRTGSISPLPLSSCLSELELPRQGHLRHHRRRRPRCFPLLEYVLVDPYVSYVIVDFISAHLSIDDDFVLVPHLLRKTYPLPPDAYTHTRIYFQGLKPTWRTNPAQSP